MESCIENLKTILSKLNVRSLLVNGNAEKQLKFLLASYNDEGSKWYLMDKKIGGHEIDLIFLNEDKVVSVAELKCTFVCDTKKSVIYDAIEKAEKTKSLLCGENVLDVSICEEMRQYIVHFLLLGNPRVIGEYSRPDWVASKYPHPANYTSAQGQEMVSNIIQMYKNNVEGKVDHVQIIPNELDVILVELQGKEVSVSC